MDRITLHAMEFYAYHGVFEEEARLGQKYIVDVSLEAELQKAGLTDDLHDTVNYGQVYVIVQAVVQGERFKLIEAVAETIASRILQEFDSIQSVRVRVLKTTPPIPGILGGASIEIERVRS